MHGHATLDQPPPIKPGHPAPLPARPTYEPSPIILVPTDGGTGVMKYENTGATTPIPASKTATTVTTTGVSSGKETVAPAAMPAPAPAPTAVERVEPVRVTPVEKSAPAPASAPSKPAPAAGPADSRPKPLFKKLFGN